MENTKNFIFILMLCTCSNIITESKHISQSKTSELLKAFNKPDRNDTSVYFLSVNEVNIVGELSLVPRNVTKLCFILENTIAHKQNEYDIAGLQHLQNLEELWITSKDSSTEGIYRNHYGVNLKVKNIYSTVYTSKLRRLHINVELWEFWRMDYKYSFTQLQNVFGQLDVLDLKGVNLFRNIKDIQRITGYSNNITALSLSAVMNQFAEAVVLNMTLIFGHDFHSLQFLDLSHNYIGAVSGSIIDSLPNLKVLDISNNRLLHNWIYNNNVIERAIFSTHANVFQLFVYHPKIKIINMDEQTSSVGCRQNTPYMRRKRSSHDFNIQTCFQIYNISVNELASLDDDTYCSMFNCFNNLINDIPLDSMALSCSFLPTFSDLLNKLDFTGNCHLNFKIPFSPHLREVSMNKLNVIHNKGYDKKINICFGRNMLEVLSLRHSSVYLLSTYFPAILAGNITFTGLDALQTLDFSQNRFDIYLNMSFFTGFKGLTKLNISDNVLKFLGNYTVKGFENLTILDISANKISVIPFQSLANLFKLRKLYAGNNQLETFNMNVTNWNFIQNIDLSDNKIKTFSQNTIACLKASRKEHLNMDLRNNKLLCMCDDLTTVELILSADKYNITFSAVHSYLCMDDNAGYRLLGTINIGKLRRDCKYPHLNVILGVTVSNAILIMLITTILLLYKYRHRLQTLHYRLKWRLTYSENNNTEYPYDAFVSYSSKDILWMHDMLMLTLENMYGFHLCVDYRDFLAGSTIVEAIIDNINKSKLVIVILSENSLNSGYCEFELKLAHDHLLRMNKKLIIIKLGDLDMTNTGTLVKHLLENRLYIEWPAVVERQYSELGEGDRMEDKKKLFWAKLRNALYHQDPASNSEMRQPNGKSLFYSWILRMLRCDCCSAESGNDSDSMPIVLNENTENV